MLRAFAAERKFLIVTTKSKKPDVQSTTYMEVLKELQSMMGAVNDIREANRASPLFTHLTTVSEGIAVLGWITIDPKPVDYVGDMLNSTKFYGNRIITLNKEKSVPLQQHRPLIGHLKLTPSLEIKNRSTGSTPSMPSSNPCLLI